MDCAVDKYIIKTIYRITQFIGFVSIFETIIAPDIKNDFYKPIYDYITNTMLIENDLYNFIDWT